MADFLLGEFGLERFLRLDTTCRPATFRSAWMTRIG